MMFTPSSRQTESKPPPIWLQILFSTFYLVVMVVLAMIVGEAIRSYKLHRCLEEAPHSGPGSDLEERIKCFR